MSKVESVSLSVGKLVGKFRQYLEQSVSGSSALVEAVDADSVFRNGMFKSTTIALGSNPAVGSKPMLTPPAISSAEIALDGLNNPYVILNFEISQESIDGNQIVAFKIYRQEVPAEDLAQEVEAFNSADFDKISQRTTNAGKFSAQKKAAYTVDQFKTSEINQNANLLISQASRRNQQVSAGDVDLDSAFSIQTKDRQPFGKLIATVNNLQYQTDAKKRQVYVQSKNSVSLAYSDYNVTYGTGYVYTITSFCVTAQESSPSEKISLVLMNLSPIDAPIDCQVKQSTQNSAVLTVTCNPKDLIKYAYVFRRNTEDLVFHPLIRQENLNNTLAIKDTDVEYLQTYIYRILLENVFGAVSEPKEVSFTCSQQKILSKTRSNNLKLPIILASQDQGGEGIKVTIFPNDKRILYYDLERRDLTLRERNFSTPTNKDRQFWSTNQFFVVQNSASLITSQSVPQIVSGSLPAQSQFIGFADPIGFVDKIVIPNNFYQYRTTGYDLYGNVTGYGFASLRARDKNSLRPPVNFFAETLRESPFRIKLTWQDDNLAARADQDNSAQEKFLQLALQQAKLSEQAQKSVADALEQQDLSKIDFEAVLGPYNVQQAQITAIQTQIQALQNYNNPLRYQLQRRLSGDTVYSSFPYTENNWVIDEVAASDAINFSTALLSGSPQPSESDASVLTGSLSRSFGVPDFLRAQQVYQYRVAVSTLDGQTSDFCVPITVIASAQISNPVSFSASVLNSRVKPAVVRLEWGLDALKNRPDHWRIERKVNSDTDVYRVIGNAYLDNHYFDRTAQLGQQYIYRIRSVSAVGDESNVQEAMVDT